MKYSLQPSLRKLNRLVLAGASALGLSGIANAALLSFDGNQVVNVTDHTIHATDWADYVGGNSTFNRANEGGRLYWRSSAGDGQFIHFDLSSLINLTLVSPAIVTLQKANASWGGGVDGSYVARADNAWTAGAGQTVPGATPIGNAMNASGSYGNGQSVSWGIGYTDFQYIVENQSSFNGLAVIGGAGSQLHFDAPMNPYLTVKSGTIIPLLGVITADTGSTTWNSSNYSFSPASYYTPVFNTLTIRGELSAGTSGAGTIVINNGGTVDISQAGNVNYYWAVDGTTVNVGGKLTINGHSNLHNLTLAGGELASTGTDPSWGSWSLPDATTVTGGVTSTISAQQVTFSGGIFNVASNSVLNFTGSTRAGSLIKNGEGTMIITGWQSYADGTTVNQGTLELVGQNSGSGWLRNSVTINPGGTLAMTAGDGTGFGWNSPVTSLTVNGGTVNASGSSHIGFGGYINVTMTNGATIMGNWQWNGDGQLGFTSSGDRTNIISGNLSLRPDNGFTHTFNVADGASAVDLLVSANIYDLYPEQSWGIASLVKKGAGTMVLSGSNSYDGGTVVEGGTLTFATSSAKPAVGVLEVKVGTLRVESSDILLPASSIKVTTGALLDLAFEGTNVLESLYLDDVLVDPGIYSSNTVPFIVGPGCLRISEDNGVWTAANDGAWGDNGNWLNNVIANGIGATAVFEGATGLNVTLDSARSLANLVFSNANYTISGSTLTLKHFTLQPSINVAGGCTATISNTVIAGSQGLLKTGSGTLKLCQVNTYTGRTVIDGGTLELAGASGGNGQINGTVTVNPGTTLAITGGDGTGFGWVNVVTNLAVNGGTVTVDSAHIGFGSYIGVTMTNGAMITGHWNWNGDGLLGFTSSGDKTNILSGSLMLRSDAGANHTFTVNDGASVVDLLVTADLSDQWPEYQAVPASALVKAGSGVMLFSGVASYDGGTFVNDGALYVNGTGMGNVTVADGKTLGGSGAIFGALTLGSGSVIDPGEAPGATGTLTLAIAPALSGVTLKVDATMDGNCDVLAVTGDVSLDGLTIDCSGMLLNRSKAYTLLTATGTLTDVPTLSNLPALWYMTIKKNALTLRSDGTLIRFF